MAGECVVVRVSNMGFLPVGRRGLDREIVAAKRHKGVHARLLHDILRAKIL